ncbi:MAG: ABC transporter permease [Ruminococcaceae bacterium]|nr:ABC transporter permease [Oscillospiraceae bacterium]
MKQFKTIFLFEFIGYLKNKVFVGLTLLIILSMGILLFSPRMNGGKSIDMNSIGVSYAEKIALTARKDYDLEKLRSIISEEMTGSQIDIVELDDAELKAKVDSGEYDMGVVITSPLSYEYVVKTAGLTDMTSVVIEDALLHLFQASELKNEGLSDERIEQILGSPVSTHTDVIANDQNQSFFYTYILMFLLYFSVIMYGQFVAQGVATEKSSRAMELLITSAKPLNLMFGKILGAGAAGFSQLILILGSAVSFYRINSEFWQDNAIIRSVFEMPARLIFFTILFFTLGFFIYAFMYGALASLASRLEDVGALTMPVSFLMIISFMITIFSMISDVDNPLMKVASFIPFTSPMAMFTRIAMGNVSTPQIIISVVILIASTAFIGYLAAMIYKIGVLMYGKPPKLNELTRALRNNKVK